jgi:hypothetical protein
VGSIPVVRWLPGMACYIAATMPKHKVGDRVLVKLSGGRIVEATIKAIVDTTDGVRLQVSFGDETARIYLWQIVEESSLTRQRYRVALPFRREL